MSLWTHHMGVTRPPYGPTRPCQGGHDGGGSTLDRTITDPSTHLLCTGAPATPIKKLFDPRCTNG